MAASTAFFQSLAFFRDGITFVNDLNKSLTEISIVTGQTQQQVAALGEEYNKLAQSMGVLTRDISNATVEFYRQGLTQEEVMKRTQVATQYAKISAMDFKRSAEVLTATVNSMGIDIERASDVFSYLGDATATGADEIGIAFQKVGGSAGALNIEFEKVASWIAVVSSRTREGASTIGQSIKGILARIQNMRENGFSEEDGTSVNEVAKALNAVGIALMDNEGNFRNFGTVMDELGAKWDTLSSRQKAYVSTTVAGTYQQSRFLNLMQGYKDTIPLYEQALKSAGTTTEKFNLYQQGTEAQINKLKATWEGLWMASFDSQTVQNIVASFNVMAKVLKATVDNFGLLPPILGIAGVAILAFNGGLQRIITNGALVLTTLKGIPFGLRTLDSALAATTLRMSLMSGATTAMTASLNAFKTAGLTALRFTAGIALPFAAFAGIGLLIGKATEKLNEFKQKQAELKKQNDDIRTSYTQHGDEINRLVNQYEILNAQVENGTLSKENEEYIQISNRLNEIFPILTRHVDERGNATLRNVDAIKKEVSYAEKLKENYAQMSVVNFEKSLSEQQDKFDEFVKQIEKSSKRLNREDNTSKHASYIPKTADEDLRLQRDIIANERELQLMLSNSADYIRDKSNAFLDISGASQNLTDQNKAVIDSFIQEKIALTDVTKEGFNFKEFLQELVNEATDLGEKLANIPAPLKEMFDEDGIKKLSNDQMAVLSSVTSSVEDGYVEWENYRAILEQVGFTNVDGIIDRLTGKLKDNTKAVVDAEKETAQLLKSYDDAVSKIESLNGIINELNDKEGRGISADSISLMIEKYPDLLAYLNDEATLRSKIAEEVEKENNIALDVATEKLKYNEQYFSKVKEGNSKLIGTLAKGYEVDLANTKTLAQFKLAVEQGLIKKLGDGWANYYDIQAQAFTESGRKMLENMSYAAAVNNPQLKAISDYESSMKSLTSSLRSFTMDAGFSNIALSGISESTSKASKEYEFATFVTDKFKASLEKLTLELEKQRKIQAQFPKHSQEYQKSLKSEISLLDQKKKLLQDQAKALDAQIKSGKIMQTGIVTTSTSSSSSYSPASSYASGGGNSSQIWNFFKSKGFTDNIVAGIMGNLQLESGLNSNALNKSSGAFGIAQWLGGRKSALQSYAKSVGTSINDLNTQLNFLWNELNSTEKKTLNYLNNNRGASASNIAAAFDRLFERSEGTHIPQRQQYANQFLSQYGGSGASVAVSGSVSEAQSKASKEVAENLQNVDQAKSELIQLRQDLLAIEAEIAEKQYQSIIGVLDVLDYRIKNIEYTYNTLEGKLDEYDPSSQTYRNTVGQMSDTLYQKQRNNASQINYVESIIKKGGLDPVKIDELKTKLQELRLEREALFDQQKELSGMKVDSYITQYSDMLDDINDQLELTQMKLGSLEQGTDEYNKVLSDEIALLSERQEANKLQIKTLENMLKTQKLSIAKQKELQELIVDLNKQVQADEYEKQNIVKESADNIIDILKKSIEKRRDIEVAALRKELDEAEKAHEAKMEMYDEDLARYEEIVNRKLGLIDDQYQDDMYNKDLGKMQSQEADLQKQINRLMMDDSQEAIAKRIELEQQLEDIREQIAQKQYDREIELRKDNLQDEMDRYKDEIEGKKDAEQEKFDAVKDGLENQIEQVNYYYNEMLADEQHFADLYKQIVSGNIDGIKGELTGFLDFFKGQNADLIKELGLSWNELGNLMNGISGGMGGLGSIGAGSGSNSGTVNKAREAAWKEYLNNKRLAETGNPTPERAAQLRAANDQLRSVWSFPDGRYNDLKNLKKYHDGGVVGGGGSKLANIINSLANTIKPNEQIVKALKGEVMIPQKNMPNFVKNIASTLIPRPSVGGSGVLNLEKMVYIENFNGTRQEVKNLAEQVSSVLMNNLSNRGI